MTYTPRQYGLLSLPSDHIYQHFHTLSTAQIVQQSTVAFNPITNHTFAVHIPSLRGFHFVTEERNVNMKFQRSASFPTQVRSGSDNKVSLLYQEVARLRTEITNLKKERNELQEEVSVGRELMSITESYLDELTELSMKTREELTLIQREVRENEEYCLELESYADSLRTEVGISQLRNNDSTSSVHPSDFSSGNSNTSRYRVTFDMQFSDVDANSSDPSAVCQEYVRRGSAVQATQLRSSISNERRFISRPPARIALRRGQRPLAVITDSRWQRTQGLW